MAKKASRLGKVFAVFQEGTVVPWSSCRICAKVFNLYYWGMACV